MRHIRKSPNGGAEKTGRTKDSRVGAWIVRIVLAVSGVGLAAAIALVLALHVPWVQHTIIGYGTDWARNELGIQLNVSKVAWNPFQGIRLQHVSAASQGQEPFLEAESVALDYRLSLSSPYFHARRLILVRPVLDVQRKADGRWALPIPPIQGKEASDGTTLRWDRMPLPSVQVIEARVRAHQDGHKILDIKEMTGILRLEGVRREDGTSGLDIRLEDWRGNVDTPSYGPVALSGRLSWMPEALAVETLEVQAGDTLSARVEGRWPGFPSGRMDIRVSCEAVCPNPILPRIPLACGKGEVRARLRLLGSPEDLQATYEVRMMGGRVWGDARLTRGDGTLSAHTSLAFQDLDVSPKPQVPVSLSGKADIRVERHFVGGISGALRLSIQEGSVVDVSLAGTEIHGTWTPEAFQIARGDVILGPGRVESSGRILLPPGKAASDDVVPWRPVMDLHLAGKGLDLALLGRALGGESISGTVDFDGSLSGSWGDPVWEGTIRGRNVQGLGVRAEGLKVVAKGRILGRDGPRRATVRLSSFALNDTRGQSLEVELNQGASDQIQFRVTGQGLLGSDRLSLQGRVENVWALPKTFRVEGGSVQMGEESFRFSGRGRVEAAGVDLEEWQILHGGESLFLSGEVTKGGPRNLRLRVQGLDLGAWSKRLAKRTFGTGVLGGVLVLDGSWESPVLSYEVAAGGIRPGEDLGYPSASVQVQGDYREGFLSFTAHVRTGSGTGVVDANGRWPLELDFRSKVCRIPEDAQGVIELRTEEFPLESGTAYLPFMETLKGTLQGRLRLAGPLQDLRLEGEGRVEHGAFQLKSWAEPFQGLRARWRLENDRLVVEDARFRLLDGDVTARGVLRHRMGKVLGYELHADGTDVRFPELFGIEGRGNAVGVFSQEGGEFRPDVKGRVQLTEAVMNLGELELDLARNIHVVGDKEEGPVVPLGRDRKERRRPGLFQRTTLDVEIHLPEKGSWVRGYGLEALVQGATKIKKTRRGPVKLYGTLQAVKGEYVFQGVRLSLVSGVLVFRGLEQPDPLLNVTCQKNVRDVSVTASLTGQLSRPVLSFSSSPAMDQVDIVSYLLYGRPAGELSARQAGALQRRGVQFVGSGTTAVVRDLLGDMPLKPDVFELKGTSDGNVVEIGKYLTPELYVTYQKGLAGDDKDQLRAEYRLNRHISVESQWGRENQSGVDVFFRYDFGD
ncbi:Autotransporter translocation and assembly factor TamB [Desulfacinum infernum DSM 9756]|uniref:Autotransporter translocation and assembly factor TamB n=1 Tax=Desulfacinum infernum DSM 9756 TaxID=1121391 RepID=A0A1M4SCF2_9BACT|nr:Autotransporter translocation and assembly factor TamB [Desulfacinum infernum DSM 9756]